MKERKMRSKEGRMKAKERSNATQERKEKGCKERKVKENIFEG